ncbi:general secretion pathway protein GspB [Arenimonas donghaensis]|uniref:Type II secretion system protein GspB C-terminal domain-containing protein n=1 Tax=Arenimonas donghaensis DSM 18148 = HO3-R19 TaxID=1121014 RepID=A0A087MI08_9GAMM|nr:general secretion pathway protein GspB [Arenimonas donghaensis]KFL36511.1 hypothetical protein N788_12825 [Arenimonas donghaensis DSM 18148 = HO3-R19]
MSLILEALKKSEAERQRGKAPGLFVEQAVLAPRRPRGTPAWVFALGALLVVFAAAAVWWGWSRGASMAEADGAPVSSTTPSVPPANEEVATVPASMAMEAPPPASVGRGESIRASDARPLPVTTPPPASPAPTSAPRPVVAPTPVPARPAARPSAPPEPVAPPAETESAAYADALPRLADLPAAERNALPPLNITMHVFTEEPAQRFVILDGRRHGEGATPTAGLVIREIRRDGLVISFNGRDVLVPRP